MPLPTYEQHPIAIELFPGGMDDAEFQAFCADIEQRGIIYPITLFQGKVLDGWHRYRAAHKTGTAWKEQVYDGKDPAGYVTAVNALRRKLSSLQRALVGARLHRDHGHTQRQVCAKLGISNEVVNLVLKALDSNNAPLIKRIETDSDFTRGMLREELVDAGLHKKPAEPIFKPKAPASVFTQGTISAAAADVGQGTGGDTDGNDDDDEDEDHLPPVGKKPTHPERRAKAKANAAQELADQFRELMADEQAAFLQMVWKEVQQHTGHDIRPTPVDALKKASTGGKKPTAAPAKKSAKRSQAALA